MLVVSLRAQFVWRALPYFFCLPFHHDSYAEETAPSSNINVTDEGESKEIIVHKTLLENQFKDVSK